MEMKSPRDSEIRMTELVLPNDTNLVGNLLGGRLMHWVDIAGALVATRHARNVVATVQMDSMDFRHPVRKGDMVEFYAKITWVGTSSMEIKVTVTTEDLFSGSKRISNEAYIVFVSIDRFGRPEAVPGLLLETEEERDEWERAVERRKHRMRDKNKQNIDL